MKKPICIFVLFMLCVNDCMLHAQKFIPYLEKLNTTLQKNWSLTYESPQWRIRSIRTHAEKALRYHYMDMYYKEILIKGTESKWITDGNDALISSHLYDLNELKVVPNEFQRLVNIRDIVKAAVESVLGNAVALNIEVINEKLNDEIVKVRSNDITNFSLQPIWFQSANGNLRAAYSCEIHLKKKQQKWNVVVAADHPVEILYKKNKILQCNFKAEHLSDHCGNEQLFSYNDFSKMDCDNLQGYTARYKVFEFPVESPKFGNQTIVSNPWLKNTNASPYGWHSIDDVNTAAYFSTNGNNAYCYADFIGDGSGIYELENVNFLDFLFDYNADANYSINKDASLTQIFYASNMMHDIMYNYGFDEEAGNFQENNSGKGGLDFDPIEVTAMLGSEFINFGNAFYTPEPDGISSKIELGTFAQQAVLSLTFTQGNQVIKFDTVIQAGTLKDLPSLEIEGELIELKNESGGDDFCFEDVDLAFADPAGKIPFIKAIDSIGNLNCFQDEIIFKFQELGAKGVVLYYENEPQYRFLFETKFLPLNIPYAALMNVSDSKKVQQLLSRGKVNVKFTINPKYDLQLDAAFENTIFIHEFGHGISLRGTDPTSSDCLYNVEAPGEGWSDWYSLVLTHNFSKQKRNSSRGIGTFVLNQKETDPGVRTYPYSTDMSVNPLTYKDLSKRDETHDIGELWCVTLWDMYWNLLDKYGFDPDLYNGRGGNNIALKLVTEAIKLQPCSPGFIDCRNAILKADSIFFDGKNRCEIWKAFAKRGMGFGALQGDPEITGDELSSFILPPNCLVKTEDSQKDEIDFTIIPNPNRGTFHLEFQNEIHEQLDIIIFTPDGKIVKSITESSLAAEYHLPELSDGVYFVQVRNHSFHVSKRMIVLR